MELNFEVLFYVTVYKLFDQFLYRYGTVVSLLEALFALS